MAAGRRRYSHQQKSELVERVLGGLPVGKVAKKEGISPNLISRWKKEYRQGKFSKSFDPAREIKKLEQIVSRLEKEVEKLDYQKG